MKIDDCSKKGNIDPARDLEDRYKKANFNIILIPL